MSNVIDLQKEREINALIDRYGQLISDNPDRAERDFAALDGDLEMIPNNEAGLLSVRLPKALINRIDDAAREVAYREKRKVTRSTLVAEWLEASIQRYEQENRRT
jgi:hypothetical protein